MTDPLPEVVSQSEVVAELSLAAREMAKKIEAATKPYDDQIAALETEREETLQPLKDDYRGVLTELLLASKRMTALLADQSNETSPLASLPVRRSDVLIVLKRIGQGNAKAVGAELGVPTLAVVEALKMLKEEGKVISIGQGRYRDYKPVV